MTDVTVDRVASNTAIEINRRIEMETDERVRWYAKNPHLIPERLKELDREWDVERVLEANAASISLIGVLMGLMRGRKWFVLPIAVGGFLLQHAIEGWCPPLPLVRQLGFRTAREIEIERLALRMLRGDFRQQPGGEKGTTADADRALAAVRKT